MNRFDELWEGYLTDKLSEDEVRELLILINQQDQPVLSSIETLLKDKSYTNLSKNDQEEFIFQKLIQQARQSRPVVRIYRWKAVAIAASILLVVSLAALFLSRKDSGTRMAGTPAKNSTINDIAPGGDKATLTLADGSIIILDTAHNGMVTEQAGIKVIKLGGKLAYQSNGKTSGVVYNTIRTPRGGQYQLVLADGTKVWLNAASSLRFPASFPGNERRVEIIGEGYFEVAHDATKPFHVSVEGMNVQVLGTYFNINAYPDEESIKTTLLQGSVKINSGNSEILLQPNQQAQLQNHELKTVGNVDVEQVIAWKNGFFSFHNADIRSVMRQLARWYDVQVQYQGELPERVFEGEMQRDLMLSQALKILEKNNVHFKTEGKKITVLR